ncbi:MAG: protein kinase [Deltaproteobacteria bacterium]|nr:protein kinase [Deltaproteobacteria bacterium]MBW2395116.1 protein kinase [Deltaproteobacteria bacterium]
MKRVLLILFGALVAAAGAYGLGTALAPGQPTIAALGSVFEAAAGAAGIEGPLAKLVGVLPGGVLLAVGVVLLGLGARSGGAGGAGANEVLADDLAATDPRMARKVEKQASRMAKRGSPVEAAELCFGSGLHERAAQLFEQADEFVRAAEIRHDQNRFQESAALYVRAGQHDTAGTIYAAQDAYAEAAECYDKAGRMSVAAEMYEKAGNARKAGECYAACEFHRYAARSFIQAHDWARAAKSLEDVVREEGVQQNDPQKREELRKLVLQTAKLYERADDLKAAGRVLEHGECWSAAAEVALRRDEISKAAELFQRAGDAPRAAETLRRIGEETAAAQILGLHLRDSGDPEEAARMLVQAGDFHEAGDIYRSLEAFSSAGECYERCSEFQQAGEMLRLGGEWARAAENYSRGGSHEEAADCHAHVGDAEAQAKALQEAGLHLRAGRVLHAEGRDEEVIEALQQVPARHGDFAESSLLLAQTFRTRSQPGLAVTRLKQATASLDVSSESVELFYTLAICLEEAGELSDARQVFEEIHGSQYNYEDVEARLHRLRDLEESLPPRGAGTGSGFESAGSPPETARYQIVSELGRGGMGIVYKAIDSVLDRSVAFKVLPDALKDNPQALKNFLREAKSAAKLNHPNIVTVYDAGEQQGRYYIAMEYVDGTTLKEIVRRRGVIAPTGVLHVALQLCEGLRYAHSQKVVHRDIKTANAMWTRDKKAKIMDFGLAKVVEEVRNHTTLVSGTPYYMSPEQTLGKNVDHRTDIYSLGVTLFELATGTLPFKEGNVPYHHVHTAPPDPREANPKLPQPLADLISKCLCKDPADRFQKADEMVELIRGLMSRSAS